MPKAKKKKKSNHRMKRFLTRSHSLRDALILGNRLGDDLCAYQRCLCIADETPLRERERKLDPLEKKVFRTWLLCYVPYSPFDQDGAESFTDHLMRKDGDTFHAIMSTAVMGALQELWTADGASGLPGLALDNVGARFADCVDEPFQNVKVETYNEQVRDLLYADYLSLRMGSMLDWDRLLNGNNLAVWSKNCLTIVERFGSEEQINYLKKKRDEIIVELCDIAISIIGATMRDCAEELRGNKIPCSYRESIFPGRAAQIPVPYPLAVPSVFTERRPERKTNLNALGGLPRPVKSDEDEISNEALCECAISRLASGCDYEDISLQITGKFSHLEIVYAALSLMAGYRSVTSAPAVIQAIFAVIVFSGFPCAVIDYGYTPRDYRKKVTLHTGKLFRLTEKQRENMRPVSLCGKDEQSKAAAPVFENLNLAQFIYSTTGVIAPPRLILSLSETRVLESYGLSRTEAVALCGYMDAMRSMRRTVDYMADNFESAEWMSEFLDDNVSEAEKSRAEIRQEVEAELNGEIAAVKELRESTESARRKMMREHRTAAYRAEKAEQQVEALQRELAELREMTASLASERDELQNALFSVSDQEPEQEPDEPVSGQFPSDIGKGIRFLVFGGNQNWIAEQRRRFPYIDFYERDTQPNPSIVASAHILMLNTFVMHHNYFGIIQDAAKKSGIPLRYFTSKGINRGSTQIIKAYEQYLNSNN